MLDGGDLDEGRRITPFTTIDFVDLARRCDGFLSLMSKRFLTLVLRGVSLRIVSRVILG